MRPRRKKHREERIARCGALLLDTQMPFTGTFQSEQPLQIEIGCGKGGFIYDMALLHPQINFLAVEKEPDVMVMALERAMETAPSNLRFALGDIQELGGWLAGCRCEGLYLNFSDPWPGKKRAKRRLTHSGFLDLYRRMLRPGGAIFLKTDNRDLFEFSLARFEDGGFGLTEVTYDLKENPAPGNVVTEYEQRFMEEGIPICRCVARLPEAEPTK